jgi:hypothetical protein
LSDVLDNDTSTAGSTLELVLRPFHFFRKSDIPMHYLLTSQEFDLLDAADVEPLKELIETMEAQGHIA